jgi:glycine cleavage system aminomethyltransferase T
LQDDTTTLPWGNESIYRNGEYTGYVTSAGFGHTLGKAVCMGYVCAPGNSKQSGSVIDDSGREKSSGVVTHQYLKEGRYEIEIDGKLWQLVYRDR